MVSSRDTKTPSENPDGVLVSRPRCAPTRPKARAGFAALRLAARFGRVRASLAQSRCLMTVNQSKSGRRILPLYSFNLESYN
jgi:hypothetical protein